MTEIKMTMERPDPETELALLKDFQRKTLDYLFKRMYTDQDYTRRFLVADEVGLGKTMIARGFITKVIEHLWDTVSRIDIVYLCSNGDIARQNVKRLTPRGIKGVSVATRITLMPLKSQGLKENKVNIIALTPGTSLDLKGNLGTKPERAMIALILKEHWKFDLRGICWVFRGNARFRGFAQKVKELEEEGGLDLDLVEKFLTATDQRVGEACGKNEGSIKDRLESLIEIFLKDSNQGDEIIGQRNLLIGEFRQILAKSCIDALEPDLIILDEFQRFKDLLNGAGAAGEMANQLFSYEDSTAKARVLLLSATPYKMFTVSGETDGDDHYADFLKTCEFLLNDQEKTNRLSLALKAYRREVFRLGRGTLEGIAEAKREIESILRKVIVRTERLANTRDKNGMLVEKDPGEILFSSRDAKAYVDIERVGTCLGTSDTIEYWKSSPWILNFMDDYTLAKKLRESVDSDLQGAAFGQSMKAALPSLLDMDVLKSYKKLDPPSGRMRWLIDLILSSGLWKALWIPPSMPYYSLGEPFASVAKESPSKALLFSTWKVVPKAVASILSHEVERLQYSAFEGEGRDYTDAPQRLGDMLQIRRVAGRVSGLSTLSHLYPCTVLAREFDPLMISSAFTAREGHAPSLNELISEIEKLLGPYLEDLTLSVEGRDTEDESWYWFAPILLDIRHGGDSERAWFDGDLASFWSAREGNENLDDENEDKEDESEEKSETPVKPTVRSAIHDLVDRLRAVAKGEDKPKGGFPKDLARVLALMAIAGPATAALRAFHRIVGWNDSVSTISKGRAAEVGSAFRTLFNQPDSTALIRAMSAGEAPNDDYWRLCLEYGAAGGLQPVLDEYCHLLVEEAGMIGKEGDEIISEISPLLADSVCIMRARIGVQGFSIISGKVKRSSENIRSKFAMRFGDEGTNETGEKVRADTVRRAFNSPFSPFVLATTSVGQEGLDFHLYCHKVIHWNLPTNPVDLEQREGRVHRFKGHAVRKNLARSYPEIWTKAKGLDPWALLFATAKAERSSSENDLVPYWVFPKKDGDSIERHVPFYPLSRDIDRLRALRSSLALYRMVFGQPRQEELLSFLRKTLPEDQLQAVCEQLMISLSP